MVLLFCKWSRTTTKIMHLNIAQTRITPKINKDVICISFHLGSYNWDATFPAHLLMVNNTDINFLRPTNKFFCLYF